MSKHWKEEADPEVHRDYMSTYQVQGNPVKVTNKLVEQYVYFVRECSFTFQFTNLDQLDEMIDYLSKKVHPSTRADHVVIEHWWHSWQERLPSGLLKGKNREKILKAMDRAREEFRKEN